MSEISNRNIQYLQAAKSALRQQQEAAEQAVAQEERIHKMEQNLEQERAAVEQSIDLMTKKRRAEIEESYNKRSATVLDTAKRTRAKREKAKSKGMKSRMEEETADVRQKNNRLKNEIRTLFQKNRVPFFCNSWVFYALYYPRKLKEILFFLLCLALVFAGIPCVAYLMLPERKTLYLVLIYVIDIFVFGGLYLLVNNLTRSRHDAVLREGRKIRISIATNKKHIVAIQNGIRKDTSEDMYGLEEFDSKLAKLDEDNEIILDEKKRALDDFDRETKHHIRQEIEENNRERLHQMELDLKAAELQGEKLREQEQFWRRKVGEQFGNQLGTEFMQEEKMDQLIEAFREGAANMMEAQEIVRQKGNTKKV